MIDLDLHDDQSYDEPNWAEFVDEETLKTMGAELVEDIDRDAQSRIDWLDDTEMWLDMAAQVIEQKNTPWEGASNVKFPLLTTAALQFHARAHTELFKGDQIVRAKIVGGDPLGEKAQAGERATGAMSTQLMYQMEDWQDDTDRLLFVLPLVGTVFRKTFWSQLLGRPASELVLPTDLIVNYFATDWERCRKTHAFLKDRNTVIEQQRLENYLDVDLPAQAEIPSKEAEAKAKEAAPGQTAVYNDKDVPFSVYECHYWWDLDEDGYAEPYIVTVLAQTSEILRIVPRFDTTRISSTWDKKEEKVIQRIDSYEYIIAYKFLPDIDSSIYGTGFGKLIGPTGSAVDSIINQLIDAGTLATMPSGFYGRGVRISRGGKIRLRPGEWRAVNTPSGQDLASNFFALPAKEPSQVLFNLLGMLIQAGEKIGSSSKAMSGENPGQNTSRGVHEDTMEAGQQVFLGIYKRVYRSLTKEYRMLQQLNYMYLSVETYNELIDDNEAPPEKAPPPQPGQPPAPLPEPKPPADPRRDFDPKGLDIIPEADPNLDNSMRKKQRTGQLMEAKNAGMPLNEKHLARMFLESIEEPDVEELLEMQPPPPSDSQLTNEIEKDKLAFLREELAQTWKLRRHEPISDMAKAMESFAKAKAIGDEYGMKMLESSLEQMILQAKQAMEEQKHQSSMQLGDKKIEVEDAKAESHAARTAATQQAARDKHVGANIDAADKHAAFEQATQDKHVASQQAAADRHASAIRPKPKA